ncbi:MULTISPECIES: CotO family spore coat protein [Geobacillus]|uniref:CotO family spore coat protein n=1 Tax=Geobacillus TaxID=129337 RepID=UPI0009C0C754|nr:MULTISPECIES: CotO family spore coat protein [Geobacillus]ARP41826.1 hypothetical protein GTHT12_00261 [Geobacillus thermodenitrificans]MEC5189018.1 hypothetical protein [Geobacillus thermodenitrificans]MED0663991.1 hypothetical protein [Geobacillus thermodenitrificans]MED4916680.1 CotO family spore coat protein [Geobacillus thermodenitrificans]OQP11505.1 hypothetical protein B1691_01945 [Geobacillus sp. 47C-IIb]
MRKEKVVETKPLLYIVQPKDMRAVAHMQETFTWANRSHQKKTDGVAQQVGEEQRTFFVKKREFQAMTLDEKLAFLTDLPAHLPPLKCEFATKEQSYEGVLKRCTATELTVVDEQGDETVIERTQLLSVTMIGFVQ